MPGSPCSPGGPGGPGWPRSPIGPVSPVGPCRKNSVSLGVQWPAGSSHIVQTVCGSHNWSEGVATWPKPTNNLLDLKSSTARIPVLLPADVTGNVGKMEAGGARSLTGHDISPQNKTLALGQLSPHRAEPQGHEQPQQLWTLGGGHSWLCPQDPFSVPILLCGSIPLSLSCTSGPTDHLGPHLCKSGSEFTHLRPHHTGGSWGTCLALETLWRKGVLRMAMHPPCPP